MIIGNKNSFGIEIDCPDCNLSKLALWIDNEMLGSYQDGEYQYGVNNPILYVDVNGDSIKVASEHRANMNTALQSAFGDNASNFSYNENGMLTFTGDTKKNSKEQANLYKGLSEAMNEKTVTNIIFGESTSITFNDGTSRTVNAADGGGAVTALVGENNVSENTILIDPKKASNPFIVYSVTSAYYKIPINPSNGPRFEMKTLPRNLGVSTFHEIGHVIYRGQTQNKVIEYDNLARKIMGLMLRPNDETHNRTVKKWEYGN
jgi:hypothetical protein